MRRGRGEAGAGRNHGHAVVLGAGIAGLATTAALASRFEQVTIVERDARPALGEHRPGAPQGRHAHVLLPAGVDGLTELLPGFHDDMRAQGAHIIDTAAIRFHLGGGELRLDDSHLVLYGATRPLLEAVLRDRVGDLPGVKFADGCDAVGLVATPDQGRVEGVRLRSRSGPGGDEHLAADLVVDTTGRASSAPRWLADLGYPVPERELLDVGVHYTTRLFHRDPDDLGGCPQLLVGIPTDGRRAGWPWRWRATGGW